jgi:hypothetical protein
MYEVVSEGVPAPVFLALREDYSCDLAAERSTTVAGILMNIPKLKDLDVTDVKAVEAVAQAIKENYPLKKDEEEPAIAETPIEQLQAEIRNLEKMPESDFITEMIGRAKQRITEQRKAALLKLATALAPFLGKDDTWAEEYVSRVSVTPNLLEQYYNEAVKFATSAAAVFTDPKPTKP